MTVLLVPHSSGGNHVLVPHSSHGNQKLEKIAVDKVVMQSLVLLTRVKFLQI